MVQEVQNSGALRGSDLSLKFLLRTVAVLSPRKDQQCKHSQALEQHSCSMLSWLGEVTPISAIDFLLAKEILWALQDGTERTKHLQLPCFWEHIWNKWHSSILSAPVLSCAGSSVLQQQLLLWIQFQTKPCPGCHPNPTLQKCRAACTAGLSLPRKDHHLLTPSTAALATRSPECGRC